MIDVLINVGLVLLTLAFCVMLYEFIRNKEGVAANATFSLGFFIVRYGLSYGASTKSNLLARPENSDVLALLREDYVIAISLYYLLFSFVLVLVHYNTKVVNAVVTVAKRGKK